MLSLSHMSNFLRKKRNFSLKTLDKLLGAQEKSLENFMPEGILGYERSMGGLENFQVDTVPLVSFGTALFEPRIRSHAILDIVRVTGSLIEELQGQVFCQAAGNGTGSSPSKSGSRILRPCNPS